MFRTVGRQDLTVGVQDFPSGNVGFAVHLVCHLGLLLVPKQVAGLQTKGGKLGQWQKFDFHVHLVVGKVKVNDFAHGQKVALGAHQGDVGNGGTKNEFKRTLQVIFPVVGLVGADVVYIQEILQQIHHLNGIDVAIHDAVFEGLRDERALEVALSSGGNFSTGAAANDIASCN